jgi:hypothetical protein
VRTVEKNEQKLAADSLAFAERTEALRKKQRNRLEALRDAQEREVLALEEAQDKEMKALEHSHKMNLLDLERTQTKELRALEDAPPEGLNKRASNGKAKRGKKRARR